MDNHVLLCHKNYGDVEIIFTLRVVVFVVVAVIIDSFVLLV